MKFNLRNVCTKESTWTVITGQSTWTVVDSHGQSDRLLQFYCYFDDRKQIN